MSTESSGKKELVNRVAPDVETLLEAGARALNSLVPVSRRSMLSLLGFAITIAGCGRTGLLNVPGSEVTEVAPDLPPSAPRLKETTIYPDVEATSFTVEAEISNNTKDLVVYEKQEGNSVVSTVGMPYSGSVEVIPPMDPKNLMQGTFWVAARSAMGKESTRVPVEIKYRSPILSDLRIDCGAECGAETTNTITFKPEHGVSFSASAKNSPLIGPPGTPSMIDPADGQIKNILGLDGLASVSITTGSGSKERVTVTIIVTGPAGSVHKEIQFMQY